jgi:lipid-A-disaccharide synthase
LPFELDFFREYDYPVDYVGNPVNDAVHAFRINPNFRKDNGLSDLPVIALLPGSRKQEIEHMLHFMLSIFPGYVTKYQFVIAGVPHFPKKYYESFIRHPNIHVVYNQTYDVLAVATAAVVTSGTATLETAMFEVPQVVCYRGSAASYAIARMVVKVKYISLPNLIANEGFLKELIQDDFNPQNLIIELSKILDDESVRGNQIQHYRKIKSLLGHPGASETTAKLMVKYLNEFKGEADSKERDAK